MKPKIGDKFIRLDLPPDCLGKDLVFIWDEDCERRLDEGNITLDNIKILEK